MVDDYPSGFFDEVLGGSHKACWQSASCHGGCVYVFFKHISAWHVLGISQEKPGSHPRHESSFPYDIPVNFFYKFMGNDEKKIEDSAQYGYESYSNNCAQCKNTEVT